MCCNVLVSVLGFATMVYVTGGDVVGLAKGDGASPAVGRAGRGARGAGGWWVTPPPGERWQQQRRVSSGIRTGPLFIRLYHSIVRIAHAHH
jgi:hypothetical protein